MVGFSGWMDGMQTLRARPLRSREATTRDVFPVAAEAAGSEEVGR